MDYVWTGCSFPGLYRLPGLCSHRLGARGRRFKSCHPDQVSRGFLTAKSVRTRVCSPQISRNLTLSGTVTVRGVPVVHPSDRPKRQRRRVTTGPNEPPQWSKPAGGMVDAPPSLGLNPRWPHRWGSRHPRWQPGPDRPAWSDFDRARRGVHRRRAAHGRRLAPNAGLALVRRERQLDNEMAAATLATCAMSARFSPITGMVGSLADHGQDLTPG
jgi:hypothetical protein